MNALDDLKTYSEFDQRYSYDSIHFLTKQCKVAWTQASKLEFPQNYRSVSSILFCGMGGSAYGARIIKSLFSQKLKIPVDVVSDYHIPAYVNENTLIILASYSGNTEETISCAQDVFKLPFDPKVIGISTGGKLEEIVRMNVKPHYTFNQEFNPSLQPRLGQGYMQMGQIAILSALGILDVTTKNVDVAIEHLDTIEKGYLKETKSIDNKAKQYAELFSQKAVHIIGAEFLEGALHSIRNPFHETGKHFATYFMLPELNHHLMEGLQFPTSGKNSFLFFAINSGLYSRPIDIRMKLTKDVLKKQDIQIVEYTAQLSTPLEQVFEIIQLGSFITFYLAMLHGVDPAKIPWVDYFKDKLKSS